MKRLLLFLFMGLCACSARYADRSVSWNQTTASSRSTVKPASVPATRSELRRYAEDHYVKAKQKSDTMGQLVAAMHLERLAPEDAHWAVVARETSRELNVQASDIDGIDRLLRGNLSRAAQSHDQKARAVESLRADHNLAAQRRARLTQSVDRRKRAVEKAFVHWNLLDENRELLAEKMKEESSAELEKQMRETEQELAEWAKRRENAEAELLQTEQDLQQTEARSAESEIDLRAAEDEARSQETIVSELRQNLALLDRLSRSPNVPTAEPVLPAKKAPPVEVPIDSGDSPGADSVQEERPEYEPTPAKAGSATMYQVRKGETLPMVAEKFYGNTEEWPVIYEANKFAIFRGLLEPGQWLLIPPGKK